MKTAVIYARYSSDNQTEQSIEGQLRVCNEYAKSHDITIVKTYIDRAMTGTNDNRPDFQKMIKDSNRKEWELVLVQKKFHSLRFIFLASLVLRTILFRCNRSMFLSINSLACSSVFKSCFSSSVNISIFSAFLLRLFSL